MHRPGRPARLPDASPRPSWRSGTTHDYPPYQRLARLIVRSRIARRPADSPIAGRRLPQPSSARVGQARPGEVRLLGPAEAPVFRLKGYYRFHFQLQSPSAAALHDLLKRVLADRERPENVYLAVDVDALNML